MPVSIGWHTFGYTYTPEAYDWTAAGGNFSSVDTAVSVFIEAYDVYLHARQVQLVNKHHLLLKSIPVQLLPLAKVLVR